MLLNKKSGKYNYHYVFSLQYIKWIIILLLKDHKTLSGAGYEQVHP